LGWITKFTKDFTNSAALKKQKEEGVSKKLIAFEVIEKAVPRHDYEIVNEDGENIGIVTSGTMSPSLKKGIGMGYVKTAYAKLGSQIFIQIRNKAIPAIVVKLPFYKD
jgi:aminomethyltransferase